MEEHESCKQSWECVSNVLCLEDSRSHSRLAVHRVPYVHILDLEGTVLVVIEVVAARLLNNSLLGIVTSAVWVEVAPGHW